MAIGTVINSGGALARAGGFTGDVTQKVHYFEDLIIGTDALAASVGTTDGQDAGGTIACAATATADALATTDEFVDVSKPFAVEFRVKAAAITDAFAVGLADTGGANTATVYGTISGSAVTAYATGRNMLLMGTKFGSSDGQLTIAENDGSGTPPVADIDGKKIAAGTYVRLGFFCEDSENVTFTVDGVVAKRYKLTESLTGPMALFVNAAEGTVTCDYMAATCERV